MCIAKCKIADFNVSFKSDVKHLDKVLREYAADFDKADISVDFTESDIDFEKMKYDSKGKSVEWKYVDYFSPGKLQGAIRDKNATFKIKDLGGKFLVGLGNFNYLDAKYKEPQKLKKFDFNKYSFNVTSNSDEEDSEKKKFNPNKLDFIDERDEINPVQTDTTDSKYLFDNEDAIIVNLKKGNPNG